MLADNNIAVQATVSIGISSSSVHGDDLMEFLETQVNQADEALYLSKKRGKNIISDYFSE